MNKKYLYLIIVFLVLVILVLFTYKTSEKIVFNKSKETLSYNFGVLNKNKTQIYKHIFRYINRKYDTLRIYGIRDGCSCTESAVKPGLYFRNDTISVKIGYNANKYKDKGAITKQVFLITNKNISEFDTVLPLTLKGFVK